LGDDVTISKLFAILVCAAAVPAAAQATPAANYTDLWWNPNENGWGLTITQHPSNQIWAIWYTYDPRQQDPSSPGAYKPLWINMPGGTWTSPTTLTGDVYVLNGTPYFQAGSNRQQTRVGTFSFSFTSSSTGTFTYNISPPSGLSSNDPAFGLPSMSGTKQIERLQF
jgi:hypothetical protein